MPVVRGLFGLLVLVGVAWLCSENRRRLPARTVAAGITLQLLLALLLLKLPGSREFFLVLNRLFLALDRATGVGTSLVFGYLGGAPLPFVENPAGSSFVLGLRALPLVLVMSALSALLFYWRILPLVVRGVSALLRRALPIGGMGTMVPERRKEIVGLGLKSIMAGVLATCMTGAVIGMF